MVLGIGIYSQRLYKNETSKEIVNKWKVIELSVLCIVVYLTTVTVALVF